jgi:antitoxin component of RelBE/YafQ-DinJ toxin-antitoxin module
MTTTINFKTDIKIKKGAQSLAKGFGLSLNDFLNLVIKNFIQNEIDSKRKYNPKFLRKLEKAEEGIKKGEVSPAFDNVKDAIAWLNSPNRKYEN